MDINEKTPGQAGEFSKQSKDTKSFSRVQRRVYEFLRKNGKSTVTDITVGTMVCDPRKHIQLLRRNGVDIQDKWITSYYGNRCKLYWIKTEPEKLSQILDRPEFAHLNRNKR